MTAEGPDAADTAALATQVLGVLRDRGQTLAVAESLTGGALGAALTAAPGASETFRGGVVAYAGDVKAGLLGVPADLLARVGAVDPEVARRMALGARDRLAATYAVATTGVAGPGPQDGRPAGEVHLAVAGPRGCETRSLALPGDRAGVRAATVRQALLAALDVLVTDGKTIG